MAPQDALRFSQYVLRKAKKSPTLHPTTPIRAIFHGRYHYQRTILEFMI